MTEYVPINNESWREFDFVVFRGEAGAINARVGGNQDGEAVLFNHSILTNSAIWHRQAQALADAGYRVVCIDSRGHGRSEAALPPYDFNDLMNDNLGVLRELGIEQCHFVGVSQGGMTGLGLAIQSSKIIKSVVVIAARADAPDAFSAAWDERIAIVEDHGVAALAQVTAERWMGSQFLDANQDVALSLNRCINTTTADGFVGCARAIQSLNFLDRVGEITCPTMLVVGQNDQALCGPMRDLETKIESARFIEIANAGHLPQLDHPQEIDAMLMRHLKSVSIKNDSD